MGPHTRQWVLFAVIIACLIFIIGWVYQSPYGPGGRYKYGLTKVSWTNGATAGTGKLVLALKRSPAATVCAGRISSFTSGLVVNSSETLSRADAETVQRLLPQIVGERIDAIDADVRTITYINITPPAGWPFASTAHKNPTWTTSTVDNKGNPTASINIIPSELGCGT